jgi:hypothetical protein
MKMDDNLNQVFNLEPIERIQPESQLPIPAAPVAEQRQDDFELARDTLRSLIGKNEAVITDLVDLARNSEHPRAYEVVGQLIKAQSDIAKDLMGLHKQKKDIEGTVEQGTQSIKTQNNIVFAGSTSDLMKMISSERAKVIDAK